MNKKRPINLDLNSLKYPPQAIVSIFHRVTGVLIFLFLPIILYLLSRSLGSEAGFESAKIMLYSPYYKLILWLFTSAFMVHLLAGIRHMVMDLNLGEELHVSRYTAVLIIVLGIIFTLLIGIWIW